jgi:SAM-dependent methyltransferase
MLKLNIGSGRMRKAGFISIDLVNIVDGNGSDTVDVILDIEKQLLPYNDDSVDEIIVDNVFEHLGEGFIFALNEMWRVLCVGGILHGLVPVAGTELDYRDITHKRHFVKDSFLYLCGDSLVIKGRPAHPKYADYGVNSWKHEKELEQINDLIYFTLTPNK